MKVIGASSPAHWMLHVEPSRHEVLQLERHTNVQVDPEAQVRLALSPADTVQLASFEHS